MGWETCGGMSRFCTALVCVQGLGSGQQQQNRSCSEWLCPAGLRAHRDHHPRSRVWLVLHNMPCIAHPHAGMPCCGCCAPLPLPNLFVCVVSWDPIGGMQCCFGRSQSCCAPTQQSRCCRGPGRHLNSRLMCCAAQIRVGLLGDTWCCSGCTEQQHVRLYVSCVCVGC